METNRTALNTLNSILRRDATDTTYKYALLRALAEIADEAEQHVSDINEKEVVLPLGLVVEKWLYYYYPLIESNLPQRSGVDPTNPNQQQIAFLHQFRPLIDSYTDKGKFPAFVSDYQGGRLKGDNKIFLELLKKLRHTITRYPMKHLGYSVYGDYYKIVDFDRHRFTFATPNAQSPVDSLFLIQNFGKFKIRREYYDVFRAVGGFVTGADAIVYQWANFTSNAVRSLGINVNDALDVLLKDPDRKRKVNDAKELYRSVMQEGTKLRCVWSGRRLTDSNLVIDHAIPFSLWGNNDLWNLLPAKKTINAKKSDRIPSPILVRQRREQIVEYWKILRYRFPLVFDKEFKVSLVGLTVPDFDVSWTTTGIGRLADKCHYLIDERGFDLWQP